jgi:hypothetical protein
MKPKLSLFLAAIAILVTLPANSHHSFAAEFDINRALALTGTVTGVEWTNPHAWLFIDAENDDGDVQNWAIELLGINTLIRRGWTRETVKPGDVIEVTGFGARDGSNTGNASSVTMQATGEMLWNAASER